MPYKCHFRVFLLAPLGGKKRDYWNEGHWSSYWLVWSTKLKISPLVSLFICWTSFPRCSPRVDSGNVSTSWPHSWSMTTKYFTILGMGNIHTWRSRVTLQYTWKTGLENKTWRAWGRALPWSFSYFRRSRRKSSKNTRKIGRFSRRIFIVLKVGQTYHDLGWYGISKDFYVILNFLTYRFHN